MSERIEWPVSNEILQQLSQIIPIPGNPISIFGKFENIPKDQVKYNSDILREKGIKDAVGNLSPVFQRALNIISDPDALIEIRMISGKNEYKWCVYFGNKLAQSTLYSILPGASFIKDPFSLEELAETLQDWTGFSSLNEMPFEITLPAEQAKFFAALSDLYSQADLEISGATRQIKPVFFSKEDLLEIQKSQPLGFSLLGIMANIHSMELLEKDIDLYSGILEEKGLICNKDGKFSFAENLAPIITLLALSSLRIIITIYKFHRAAGCISQLYYLFLQSNVHKMAMFEFQQSSVSLKTISSKEFLSQLAFFIQEKIYQIPDPQPDNYSPTATIVLNTNNEKWLLIPQDGNKPIEIKETTRIGRHPKNQIVISEPSVSRWHAQIEIRSGECWLTDLGSSNGTFINENRIQTPSPLKKNDRIRIGPMVFLVNFLGDDPYLTENLGLNPIHMAKSRFCPRCGKPAQPGAHFCDQCGNQLSS